MRRSGVGRGSHQRQSVGARGGVGSGCGCGRGRCDGGVADGPREAVARLAG